MSGSKIAKFRMPSLNEFDFQIKYTEINPENHFHEIDLHMHSEFEIYINIEGDVSFLVNDSLYPISRGDVILARPGEQHHCVYRSDKKHKLFWILFDSEKNSAVFDFLKPDFAENFIAPADSLREELIEVCYSLIGENLSDEEKLYSFLRLFSIFRQSTGKNRNHVDNMPKDMRGIIDYINRHINEELTVSEIAREFYISQSTLERRFRQILNVTPLEFIRKKKIFLAAQMLRSGESVLQTGTELGYSDNSYFIELFKRYFGCTPHEYKKNNRDYHQ